jgi:DnaJ-class molecular chaperone
MSEVCAECGGSGVEGGVEGGCSWCDGTGRVGDEKLAPPAPPEQFTLYVIRANNTMTYKKIVTFEPMDGYYRFIDSKDRRFVIPYSRDILCIEVNPDEQV